MKRKIFVKFVVFMTAVCLGMLTFFYVFQYLPLQKMLLKKNLYDRVKTISSLSMPTITKALQIKDDLMLLVQIENITKQEDVDNVYLLGNNNMVITHNKTGEWGKIYADEVSKKAVTTKKVLMQKLPQNEGYLFSQPVTSSITLCIGLSVQKLNSAFASATKSVFYSATIVLIIVISIFLLFINSQMNNRFVKLEELLKSVMLGTGEKIEMEENDEFGELAQLTNDVISKFEMENTNLRKENFHSQKKSTAFIHELSKDFINGVVVTDAENKILYINAPAKSFFAITEKEPLGKHILDIIKTVEIIDIIKESTVNINKTIEKKLKDTVIRTTTVCEENHEIIGTIFIIGTVISP